jgi:hypothetical protein
MAGMIQTPYGHTTVSRIEPLMPPEAYKTYGIARPVRTHWRPATCEEAGCAAFSNGWVSTFDLATELGRKQYDYCSHDKTRSFTEQRDGTTLVRLTYGPGNKCFQHGDHKVPLERPARFYVAEGDFRGNPRGIPVRVHRRAEDWCEDFAEHQDAINTAIERG